jgi:3-oxoacyl-[acyl-carrier protein] reductase
MINLKNTNVVLTGATGGIGNCILENLVNAEANVVATGTNEEKLSTIKNKYQSVKVEKFDISKHKEIENFINKVNDKLGNKIDILINNAGVTSDNLSIRMKEEEWKKVIDINLTSTFLLSKNVVKKRLKNKKGKIKKITSVVGHTGNIGQANYTASKAGLVAMSKSFPYSNAKLLDIATRPAFDAV